MNFLADECCDAGLVAALRADGHDVLFAIEDLRGSSDEDLLRQAFAEDRILLTEDKDFGGWSFDCANRRMGLCSCGSASTSGTTKCHACGICWNGRLAS